MDSFQFSFYFFSLDSGLSRGLSWLSITVAQKEHWGHAHKSMLWPKLNNDMTGPWLTELGLPKWLHFCFSKNTEMKRAAQRKWRSVLPGGVTITSAESVTSQSNSASRGPSNSSCPFNHEAALLHQCYNSPMAGSSLCLFSCQCNNLFDLHQSWSMTRSILERRLEF